MTGPEWNPGGLGARSQSDLLAIRHSLLFATIILILAFAVSSPAHLAFWVVLCGALFVLGLYLGRLAWRHPVGAGPRD